MAKQKVYFFKGIKDLYADASGNFYFNNCPARKIYNNGSIAVLAGTTKLGIKKLRTLAYASSIDVYKAPF